METRAIKVLLIEDNPGDARLIREFLRDAQGDSVELEHADRLSCGLERLSEGGVDVVLLDLLLPDSRGIATVDTLHLHAPEAPIVVLTGHDDEELGLAAVQIGAQDYLVKGHVDGAAISRSMRYAIERHRMQARLHAMTLVDDMTRLYNRRGFMALARQQLAIAERTGRRMALLFSDVDNLKEINDGLGHHGGDEALVTLADVFRETFRKSDVIGRMGGDEFAVLAYEISGATPEVLIERLEHALERRNQARDQRYPILISVGVVYSDPAQQSEIEELLALADIRMYEEKRRKKKRA